MAIKIFKNLINKLKKIFSDEDSNIKLKHDSDYLKTHADLILDRDIAIIRSTNSIDHRKLKIEQFDFVENSDVRRQLITDYIKMMTTPSYDFDMLCQYSYFQVEQLINYYYNLRFKGVSAEKKKEYFLSHIKDEVFKKTRKKSLPESIGKISVKDKLTLFWNEFEAIEPVYVVGLGNDEAIHKKTLKYDINHIQYVRNTVHRDAYFTNQDESLYYSKNKKIFNEINNKPYPDRSKEEKSIYYKMLPIKFRNEKNTNKVIKRTNSFVRVIKIEIEKQQQKNYKN